MWGIYFTQFRIQYKSDGRNIRISFVNIPVIRPIKSSPTSAIKTPQQEIGINYYLLLQIFQTLKFFCP